MNNKLKGFIEELTKLAKDPGIASGPKFKSPGSMKALGYSNPKKMKVAYYQNPSTMKKLAELEKTAISQGLAHKAIAEITSRGHGHLSTPSLMTKLLAGAKTIESKLPNARSHKQQLGGLDSVLGNKKNGTYKAMNESMLLEKKKLKEKPLKFLY